MKTVNEIINIAYQKYGQEDFVFEKVDDKYHSITYQQFIEDANSIAAYLLENGYKDSKIILYAANSCNYMKIDLAILAYVGICVNVSVKTNLKDLVAIAKNIDCNTVLYDSESKIESVEGINFLSFQELLEKVKFNNKLLDISRDIEECIGIFFSSGTTSIPKGVMLNTRNIFFGWESLQRRTKFSEKDIIYLFLPLHHTYANVYNFLYSFLSGLKIYLCSDIKTMSSELLEVNPTLFCGVPLIFNKFALEAKENLKYAFGNRIRYLYTGGAITPTELKRHYRDNGLLLLDAYALTEVASSFSIDYPNEEDLSCAGTIYEDIDVKVIDVDDSHIGEVVVKGDNVFMGYIHNEELTRLSFTSDGYFKTGDLGYIVNNHLYIKGRKDKTLICSNGENVNITRIENKIKELSNDILKIKATIRNDKIHYFIYVNTTKNIKNIIKEYNSSAESIYQIKYYEILDAENMSFKEKI